jgi:hypothetical protein
VLRFNITGIEDRLIATTIGERTALDYRLVDISKCFSKRDRWHIRDNNLRIQLRREIKMSG